MPGLDELILGPGGSMDIPENQVLQSGYGSGPDSFRVLVEQTHMPTKVLRLLLELNGSLITASASLYDDIVLNIDIGTQSLVSQSLNTPKITHDGDDYVIYSFTFNQPFLTNQVVSYELLNARTDFGFTDQIVKTSVVYVPPESFAALASFRGPFGLPADTTDSFAMFDVTVNNPTMSDVPDQQIGLLAWSNGYDLRFNTTRNIQLYDCTNATVLHTFQTTLDAGTTARVAYSNSTTAGVSSPWIPHGSAGWESTLNDVIGGHHWLYKRVGYTDAARYISGSTEYLPGTSLMPGGPSASSADWLTAGATVHLGNKNYNVIFVKWTHQSGNTMNIYTHGTPDFDHLPSGVSSVGRDYGPEVQRHSSGFSIEFARSAASNAELHRHAYDANDGDEVRLVIYNDDQRMYSMVQLNSNGAWITQEHVRADYDMIYGGHQIVNSSVIQPESVWYGSDSNTLLVGEAALQSFVMGGTTQTTGGTFDLYKDQVLVDSIKGPIDLGVVSAVGRTFPNFSFDNHPTRLLGTMRHIYFYDQAKDASHVTGFANPTPGTDGVVYAWTVATSTPEIAAAGVRIPRSSRQPEVAFSVIQWTPPGDTSVTVSSQSGLTAPLALVVNNECTLRASFTGAGDEFQTAVVTGLIVSVHVSVAGATATAVNFASATIDAASRTIDFAFTATSKAEHVFTIRLKDPLGVEVQTDYTMTIASSSVFDFPNMNGVSKSPSVVTLGQPLTITSTWASALPTGTTLTATYQPSGGSVANATVGSFNHANTACTYTFVVDTETSYTGIVTLTVGSASKQYTWAGPHVVPSFTLTGSDIHVFPDNFTLSGDLKEANVRL